MKIKEIFLKLDKKSLGLLGLLLFFMPFRPEPHLYQKFKMLMDGTLTQFIDILDVLWHLFPLTLYFLRVKMDKKLEDQNKI